MKKKFYHTYQNKSTLELEEIVRNEKSYQKDAVSFAKQILANRKDNPEKILDQSEKSTPKTDWKKPPQELKYSLEERRQLVSLYKKKSTALFTEYFLFSFMVQIIFEILGLFGQKNEPIDFLKIFAICFFIYYSASEFLFNKTLIMHFFGMKLTNLNRLSFRFIIYALASILDRTVFAPFHMLFAFSNDLNVFFCEKVSGIKWKLNKK